MGRLRKTQGLHLRTLFYIKMQKVVKSRKLECTLDVLCHLYQTQMLLVAIVFAALLLFIISIFQFNWFVFIKLYLFYLNVYLSLYLCTNKLEKFCLINAIKLLCKWLKVFFLYYLFYIFNTWSVYWFDWLTLDKYFILIPCTSQN